MCMTERGRQIRRRGRGTCGSTDAA
ncbi:hypothetical protein R2601_03048 [Salipiger bermudensis HTCC2601]|uniref:Uncharacterized protein n=1 Tax=Salipiger bermudensis (strain DSM 26914 / JCM 13377 / KCTC 12554 / HTCC2601) TaxID=314265 RepID=Q0FWN6_SALBH|nr:hypothetical protein R2601_03048 [Salipiger bermudensis HTCC2601]